MIKKAIILSLAIIILAQSSRDALAGLWFIMNRDYIARELCVNVKRPELECAGKCYLTKVLEENAETRKDPIFVSVQQRIVFTYIIESTTFSTFDTAEFFRQASSFNYFFNYSFQAVFSVFRPPSFLL